MELAALVTDELAVRSRHAVDPDAGRAEIRDQRPLLSGVNADLVRVAGPVIK